MVSINLRMPEDVIEDLKEIAPTMGFSGYQPLIRAYIGRGLREDLFMLEDSRLQGLTESLRAQGVADEVIAQAMQDSHFTSTRTPQLDPVLVGGGHPIQTDDRPG